MVCSLPGPSRGLHPGNRAQPASPRGAGLLTLSWTPAPRLLHPPPHCHLQTSLIQGKYVQPTLGMFLPKSQHNVCQVRDEAEEESAPVPLLCPPPGRQAGCPLHTLPVQTRISRDEPLLGLPGPPGPPVMAGHAICSTTH